MATLYTNIDSNKRKTAFLMFGFLLFIIFFGWVFAQIYNNSFILYFAVLFSTIQAFVAYYQSDKIALSISGAKEIQKKDNPELYRIVENLCITAGLPLPKVYTIDDSAPNAFATGRDPKHASIAVTTGLLDKLEKNELEGVIAHELSHIGNYDIRLQTIVVVLVGIIALISDWFLHFSINFSRDEDSGKFGLVLIVIGFLLAILSPIIATFIQLAISRKREFLADSSGALLTRHPEGLVRALEKISADTEPLEVANKATAHMYFDNPIKEHKGKDAIGWFSKLFLTHPPVEERIKALRGME